MPSSNPPSRGTSKPNIKSSRSFVDEPENLILPDGPVGEETAELLSEFVHPRQETGETLVDTSDDELDQKIKRPWYRTPSPYWLIATMPLSAIAMSSTIAPRIEIYTLLACSVYKPDIFKQSFPHHDVKIGLNEISYPKLDRQEAPPLAYHHSPNIVPVLLPDFTATSQAATTANESTPSTPRNQCASDPVVQAAVAKLTAVITTTMGILSCITTGWWGAFSDRYGRTRVMGLSALGLLVADFNFIGVATFWKHLPGGYWLLIIGPIAEGFLGGMTTGVAAFHSYMADTTNEGARSRMFSLSLGLLFTGMAVGPTLGSLLIRFTGKTLSVFYVAAGIHVLITLFVWTFLPESLTKGRMDRSKAKYEAENSEVAIERERNPAVGILVRLRRLFAFLSPLTLLMPIEEKRLNGNPLKAPKKDWNLSLLALGYAFTITLAGSYSVKFQYAASAFQWSSEIIGYWLSLIGATRAIFLAIVLPLALKFFKPKPITIEIPVEPRETTPLLGSSGHGSPNPSSSSTLASAPATKKKEIHSPSFDLNLARASLFIDTLSYVGMGIASKSGPFTWFGILGAFGAGFSPAIQSVALALYARRGGTEIGRLFGALSVLQALCSQIIGPAVYGLVYIRTVAVYPRTIFFVSTASVAISFVLLGFVRLSKERDYRQESLADLEEPTSSALDTQPTQHSSD